MAYVIYNKESTLIFKARRKHSYREVERYETERAAKGALTRAVKSGKIENREDYAIAEYVDFLNNIEKWVPRVNMMSGEEYQERMNEPRCTSPSSELYWSM